MQQQSPQMINNNVPFTSVTTEQIQQVLDENKRLIVAIMEHQNVGKFAECAPYLVHFQRNLTFLAQFADVQAQLEASSPKPPQQSAVQEGQHYQQQNVKTPMSLQQSGQAASTINDS